MIILMLHLTPRAFMAFFMADLLSHFQIAMGAARLGFVATFMSDPMISGFTTGSAVLVVISQVKHILGLKVPQIPAPLAAPKVLQVYSIINRSDLLAKYN